MPSDGALSSCKCTAAVATEILLQRRGWLLVDHEGLDSKPPTEHNE